MDSTPKRHRSARPAMLVISGTALYFLILLLVLYVLDRQLYTGAKQELIRNSSHRIFAPPEQELARDALHHQVKEVRARAQQRLGEQMEGVVNGPTSMYMMELRDRHDQVLAQATNPAKVPQYNTWRNTLLLRNFSGQTSVLVRPREGAELDPAAAGLLMGRYTTPRAFAPIEALTARYRVYAVGLVVLWVAVYGFLYHYLLRPVRNVTSALESSRDGSPVLLPGARGALEKGYNVLAARALLQQIVDRLNRAIRPELPGDNHRWALAVTEALEIMSRGYGADKLAAAELSDAGGELAVIESFTPGSQVEALFDAELLEEFRAVDQSGAYDVASVGSGEFQADGASLPHKAWFKSSVEAGEFMFAAPVDGGTLAVTGRLRTSLPDVEFRLAETRKACESLVRGHQGHHALRQGIIRERSEANIVLSRNLGHDLTNIIATSKLDLMAVRRLLSKPGAQLDGPRGEVLQQSVNGLLESTRFLQEIVNIYRSFSHVKRPMYERRELRSLIEEFLAAFEPSISTKVKISRELDVPMPAPIVEPRLLKLALFNVLTNALDAMKRKTGDIDAPLVVVVRIRYLAEAGQYRIEIEDNGPGIRDGAGRLLSNAEVQAVFEYGYSTKTEGSEGLGLNWVRTIMTDFHDGAVLAENLPAGGAQFTLLLQSMERSEAKVGRPAESVGEGPAT